jgi:Concanavalin A-like lectin/glucanases superfamily
MRRGLSEHGPDGRVSIVGDLPPAGSRQGSAGARAEDPSHTSVRVDGGYARVPYSPALNPAANQKFSVEAWVHPEWSPDEMDLFRCVVASREDTGANKHGYILYAGPVLDPTTFATIDPTMHWQAWVGDGTTWLMLVGPKVDVDVTTYLLLTYDGVTQTLTLDALNTNVAMAPRLVRPGATTYSPNPAAAAKPFYSGMGAPEIAPPGNPMYPFLGSLQEVAFYNEALTKDQAAKHFMAAGGV